MSTYSTNYTTKHAHVSVSITNLSRLRQSLHVLQQHCMKAVWLHKFLFHTGKINGFLGVHQSLHCFAWISKGSEKTREKECSNSELDNSKVPMSQQVCKHNRQRRLDYNSDKERPRHANNSRQPDKEETPLTWLIMIMPNKSYTLSPNRETEAQQWMSSSVKQKNASSGRYNMPNFRPPSRRD